MTCGIVYHFLKNIYYIWQYGANSFPSAPVPVFYGADGSVHTTFKLKKRPLDAASAKWTKCPLAPVPNLVLRNPHFGIKLKKRPLDAASG